ncbi:MAG: VWA domain-containing protein [Luteitalea sp.]|nr:VWA domain-containing protein [Luteitalea sp.]
MLDAVGALESIGVGSRRDVRAALRALFVHRYDDLAVFEAAFDLFWRPSGGEPGGVPLWSLGERPTVVARPVRGTPVSLEHEQRSTGSDQAPAALPDMGVSAYSAHDVLRTKDFSEFSPDEIARAHRLMSGAAWRLGARRTRRWEPARRGAPDLRRVLRRNLKHAGELLDVPARRRRTKPRPIVVLCDVSGSMEGYSRMLLHFVFGIAHARRSVEAFLFATRLTRVTRYVSARGVDDAVARMGRAVVDWGGGTRIGESLRTFNTKWTRRVMRHGPVVLIISDGWDRGDPALVAREMARVRRSCHRLIWLNPLLGSSTYEPLTRGMRTALRVIDDFMPVHNIVSLDRLADHLRALPDRRGGGRSEPWTSKVRTRSTLRPHASGSS